MTNTTTKKGAVKGAVAAAAGIAVLLGGAGTFAMWNASSAIGTADATTGHLTATFDEDGVAWVDANNANKSVDIETFRLVPGDELVGTTTITVDAVGDNIAVAASAAETDGGTLPAGVSADVTLSGEKLQDGRLPAGESELTATIDLKFSDAAGAQESMGASIDLSKINVTIAQVVPATQG